MTNRFSMRASQIAALAGVAALAACADAPTAAPSVGGDDFLAAINAPAAAPVARPEAALFGARASIANPTDTAFVTFTVGAAGGTFAVGRHWVHFPANSVCDMAVTSYGPGEWNKPCATTTEPVTIHAKAWGDSAGVPRVEFSEHLRFDPTKQVILHMSFDYRDGDEAPEIFWLREANDDATDEGAADPALVTRDGNYWMVFRRIKHFSGYLISTGRLGLRVDVEIDLGLRNRFGNLIPAPVSSGHLVATGRNGEAQNQNDQ